MNQVISPILPPNVLKLILVTYDESVFYVNNGIVTNWGSVDKNEIWYKLQELSVHMSDFICKSSGYLYLSQKNQAVNNLLSDCKHLMHTDACIIIHLGSNRDGW